MQHPMKKVYSSSVLHGTIRQVLLHYQAAKKALKCWVRKRRERRKGEGKLMLSEER